MKRALLGACTILFLAQAAQGSLQSLQQIGSTTRKYPEVKEFLKKLAADAPANSSLVSLGLNDGKEEILGLRIGKGPVKNLLVAAHHGNEYGSTELALAFAEHIAKQPIAGQTLYVIPVLNISGYNSRQRQERGGDGKSYDPNRNYPGACGTEGPFTLKSTKALADFVESEGIVASATIHTFFPAVVYPWGLSSRDLATAHPAIFTKMVTDATELSRYKTGNSSEVIYPADGTYEDYVFDKHGVWSILFEVARSHSPDESAIQDMIRTNVPGLRKMFENAPVARAANHRFTGRCDVALRALDRHDE
jgi:carboxypeptidase T